MSSIIRLLPPARDPRAGRVSLTLPPTPGQRPNPNQTVRLVISAPAHDIDAGLAQALITGLYGLNMPLILELSATRGSVEVAVLVKRSQARRVERAIRGSSFLLDISATDPIEPDGKFILTSWIGQHGRKDVAPLKDIEAFAKSKSDPIHSICESVMPLYGSESFHMHIFLHPLSKDREQDINQQLYKHMPAWLAKFTRVQEAMKSSCDNPLHPWPEVDVPQWESSVQKELDQRNLYTGLFECLIALTLTGDHLSSLHGKTYSLDSVFKQQLYSGWGGLQPSEWQQAPLLIDASHPSKAWLVAAVPEIASLWHPLTNQVRVPGVTRRKRLAQEIPQALLTAQGIQLGTCRYRGKDVPIPIPVADVNSTQLAVTGQTGMGKTELLSNIASQEASDPNNSVLVLDAHGDLSLKIISAIPDSRINDVLLFDLGDTESGFSFPWLQRPQGADKDDWTQVVFKMFHTLLESLSPTRMTNTIYALSSTLCSQPNPSLLDIPKLFDNSEFRRKALEKVGDSVTRNWWTRFEEQSASTKRDIKEPVLNRLDALYRTRAVRNLLCQRSGVDLAKLLRQRKIVLISLAGKAILSEKPLIGDYFISQLHLELLSRLGQSQESYPRTYVFVDEASNYRGPSLPALYSEARKVKINITLASQYLKQFSESIAEAILGNAMMLSFACGPMDSPLLSKVFKPMTPDILENLDPYECVVKPRVNRQTMPPLIVQTRPLTPLRDEEAEQLVLKQIRTQTRERFARPRAEVEAEFRRDDDPPPDFQEDVDIEEE